MPNYRRARSVSIVLFHVLSVAAQGGRAKVRRPGLTQSTVEFFRREPRIGRPPAVAIVRPAPAGTACPTSLALQACLPQSRRDDSMPAQANGLGTRLTKKAENGTTPGKRMRPGRGKQAGAL